MTEQQSHVSTDVGPFAIVPLWAARRLNEGQSASAALSVLIALHQWTDSSRYGFPSHQSIANVAGISVPSVKRGLRALEDIGIVEIVPRWIGQDGKPTDKRPMHSSSPERTSNGYLIRYSERRSDPTSGQIRPDPSPQIRPDPSGQIRPSNQTHLEPDPSEQELTLAIAPRSREGDDGFADFWKMYPRKIGKPKCGQRWARMSQEQRAAALLALPQHLEHWRRTATDVRFVPHPLTWLNAERWTDELASDFQPEPERKQSPGMSAVRMLLEQSQVIDADIVPNRAIGAGDA